MDFNKKANLIGTTIGDSVVIDYDDKSIYVKDNQGNVTCINDGDWLYNFYDKEIKASNMKELIAYKKEIKENDELTSNSQSKLIAQIDKLINIKQSKKATKGADSKTAKSKLAK